MTCNLSLSCSRSLPDLFSVQDEAGTPAGPELVSATDVTLYTDPREPVAFHLRAMFVLKGNHHTVYFRAGPGMVCQECSDSVACWSTPSAYTINNNPHLCCVPSVPYTGTEIDRAGLKNGWHYYDSANQGRIKFIDATHPVLQIGDLPCNISCLLYERVPHRGGPQVGSSP